MAPVIRPAAPGDLPRLLEIYNDEVLHGAATFDLEPKTLAERQVWFDAHNVDHHPLYVSEEAGVVTGYVSLSPYREKAAFDPTVELSIYIDRAWRGKGVATALMAHALAEARRDARTHHVISVITAGNEASIRLHERFGFVPCGTLPEVGYKFGRYWDVVHYCLIV
ncbi:MAG: N-acetyltransferase [Oscillospiraceae bacterium]|nr:N-acetyltransferase [Oscillospiraceae bacterium]